NSAVLPSSLTMNFWEIVPAGFFARNWLVKRDGEIVATLQMTFWTEGCQFSIAGHQFAIRRTSMWKDGFQLLADGQSVCDVKRSFWSRVFELTSADQYFQLSPTGWFTRTYQLTSSGEEVGIIRPAGWFTMRRVAEFSTDVPPPVQLLAIFLVLIV